MTYKARSDARRERKLAARRSEIERAVTDERARGDARMRTALARRPFRVPAPDEVPGLVSCMCGLNGERVYELGEAPSVREVVIPVDSIYALGRLGDPRALLMDRRLFVCRPWRATVGHGQVVQWWQWSPATGPKEYPAVRHMRGYLDHARAVLKEGIEAARYFPLHPAVHAAEIALRHFDAVFSVFDDWVGSEAER